MPMALLATAFRIKDDGCVLAASLKANLQRNDPNSALALWIRYHITAFYYFVTRKV